MSILEVNNINKSFGKNHVLRGISFSLEKGNALSIIGSSGSGKTTLLRCLNFLETPDEGRITVDGKLLLDAGSGTKLTDAEIRRNRLNFGLVFQQFNLFPQYSVTDNLTLPPRLALKEEIKRIKKESGGGAAREFRNREYERIDKKAKELLIKVGLSEKADAYPGELSGGQQQRVAIARALAMEPKILCFDEPTSALDPELTGEVLKAIRELKDTDTTMIVVTHEMDFAHGVSDRVIYMSDGVIEEEGTSDEVFLSPHSEKLKSFLMKTSERI